MLVEAGHKCYVEHDAGLGVGYSDQEYEQSGARSVYPGHEAFGRADLLVKVARPLLDEIEWLRPGTALTGLLHLNSARQDKIDKLLEREITAIALEQIQLDNGDVPVRYALAQIGGHMAPRLLPKQIPLTKSMTLEHAPGILARALEGSTNLPSCLRVLG